MSQLQEEMYDHRMRRLSASGIELPVFTESSTITAQPQPGEFSYQRRPIPVSTINWRSTNLTQFIPMYGLDFLLGVEQVYIQQTAELNDSLFHIESENRYTIKVPYGETLYLASETSNSKQRLCFGSRRAFNMRLYDPSRQEAASFVRRLAFANCLCGCYLQELQVWVPPGELIGTIKQDWTLVVPTFSVINQEKNVIYKIEGPTMCMCSYYKEAHFKIYSADGTIQLGSILHQWDQVMVCYNLNLTFPSRNSSTKEKVLLIGAAFLLEYLWFERLKNSPSIQCAC